MIVSAFFCILAALAASAGATIYDFNGLNPPGGQAFINSFSPNYDGLTYGGDVGAMDSAEALSLGWDGIEGHAGLLLPDGFHDFVINFPSVVGEISFFVGSPFGNQVLTVNGVSFNVGSVPFTKMLTLNASYLHITAEYPFTFDSLACAPFPIPLPPAVWLFGSGLLGLAGIRLRKSCG